MPGKPFPAMSVTVPPTPSQEQPESGFLSVDGPAAIAPSMMKKVPAGSVFVGLPMVAVGGTGVNVALGVSDDFMLMVDGAWGVPNVRGGKVDVGVHVAGNTRNVGVAVRVGVGVI